MMDTGLRRYDNGGWGHRAATPTLAVVTRGGVEPMFRIVGKKE